MKTSKRQRIASLLLALVMLMSLLPTAAFADGADGGTNDAIYVSSTGDDTNGDNTHTRTCQFDKTHTGNGNCSGVPAPTPIP